MPKLLFPLLVVMAIASLVIFWPTQNPTSVSGAQTTATDRAIERTARAPDRAPERTVATRSADIELSIASTASPDRIARPPLRQTFTHAPYQLVISARDSWQTPLTTGQLYEGSALRWQKDLPHEYGPRFALVSPAGQVLLLDEFINVASPYALTLLNPNGEIVMQRSFDDVQKALHLSPAALTRQAVSGWWISAPPRLSAQGDHALIKTGGTTLEVDLTTGTLSRRADL